MTSSGTGTSADSKPLLVLGDEYTIKLGGQDTGGGYAVIEIACRPGSGTPLHKHTRELECFVVLEGQFQFTLGDASFTVGPGVALHAPANVQHRFVNESDKTARMLVFIQPAGSETMFEEIAAMPPGPPDLEKLVEICGRYGITLLG